MPIALSPITSDWAENDLPPGSTTCSTVLKKMSQHMDEFRRLHGVRSRELFIHVQLIEMCSSKAISTTVVLLLIAKVVA
jgi:hypothetical protein